MSLLERVSRLDGGDTCDGFRSTDWQTRGRPGRCYGMTRKSQRATKPPVVVADFAVLDTEWAAYIERGALADGGVAYAKRWEVGSVTAPW